MLVLSRKKDECIVINNDITIVVVEIRGDKVRLGVEAPKEVPVHRREVYEAIVRGDDVAVTGEAAPIESGSGPSAVERAEVGHVDPATVGPPPAGIPDDGAGRSDT